MASAILRRRGVGPAGRAPRELLRHQAFQTYKITMIANTDRIRSKQAVAATIELDLAGMSHGPAAVGRLDDGRVVFARGGAPGERVRVRVERQRKSHLEGVVVQVVTPAEARREPPCPHVRRCGGCPWQHLTPAAQLASKLANVRREIGRLPHTELAVVAEALAAPAEWGYRHRVRLHADRRRHLGYQEAQSHAIVPIEVCPIAHPDIVAHLPVVRALVEALRSPLETVDVVACDTDSEVVIGLRATGPLAHGDRPLIDQLLREVTTVRGVFAHGPHWAWQRGDLSVSVQPLEAEPPITVPATAFIQANPAANQGLVGAMLAAAAPAMTDRVLELHAGSGNFAVALAPRVATLRAVERHRGAARALETTVRSRGWKHVEVIATDAARELETLVQRDTGLEGETKFDLAVADPPRTGMAAEAALLARLRPPRLVYTSCDLATFARDARILLAADYRLSRVQPIDLFPQTFHIELVASFERTG